MAQTPTAERILDSALELFAEKGYDGTGVDLIAEKAGIRGPSLYRHYKGKEDILNALVERGEEHYERNFGSQTRPGKIPESFEEAAAVTLERIRFTLHDPEILKFRRVLAMEQFRNQRIAELTTRHHMEGIVKLYTKIFTEMMKAGMLKEDDPELLAVEFVSPITLLIHACDRLPENEKIYVDRMEKHIRHFLNTYGI